MPLIVLTKSQKTNLVSITFLSITLASMEAIPVVVFCSTSPVSDTDILSLENVLYLHYPILFQKDKAKVQTLIDFQNEINVMTLVYASKLGLKAQTTSIGT